MVFFNAKLLGKLFILLGIAFKFDRSYLKYKKRRCRVMRLL